MTGKELFEIWGPDQATWSRWAKPILFAEFAGGAEPAGGYTELASFDLPHEAGTAIVVDLPGAESVKTGLALALLGYRPVPLFNGAPGPGRGVEAMVDLTPIMQWLAWGAPKLVEAGLPTCAPPAFLLDANRQAPGRTALPGRFDNRWLVFPQDFPSAGFLRTQGIHRVLLLQAQGTREPATDLAHVLVRWQEAGLELFFRAPTPEAPMVARRVSRPSHFKALWYRALALAGLRPNSAGGFGAIVPEPSSSG